MRSLYESILDVDDNINQANINIKNINKIKSIIHNFIDDIIDTSKYSYTILQEHEDSGTVMVGNKVVKYKQLIIRMRINERKRYDYGVYTWIKSVFDKHKKDLLSICKILGCNKGIDIGYEKRQDNIYVNQLIYEYYNYNFFIRKSADTIFITVNDVYVDDIKKLIDSKNIIRS